MSTALVLILVSFFVLTPSQTKAQSTNLATASDTLSRLKASEASVSHTIQFTTPTGTTLTNASRIYIATANFTFSGTPVVLDDGVSVGSPSLAGTNPSQYVSIGGSVTITAGSVVTITGLSSTNPSAGSYTITLTGDVNGNGTLTDTGDASTQIAVAIISDDQVVVSATVDPTLTVTLSANSVSLGTLSQSTVNRIGIQQTTSTNGAGGYTATVRAAAAADVNLDHTTTTDTIPAVADGAVTVGSAEYGVQTNQAGDPGINTEGGSACTTSLNTGHGTQSAISALTTSAQTFSSSTAPISSDATILCFNASITGTTPAGAYRSTVTLVTTATF